MKATTTVRVIVGGRRWKFVGVTSLFVCYGAVVLRFAHGDDLPIVREDIERLEVA